MGAWALCRDYWAIKGIIVEDYMGNVVFLIAAMLWNMKLGPYSSFHFLFHYPYITLCNLILSLLWGSLQVPIFENELVTLHYPSRLALESYLEIFQRDKGKEHGNYYSA